MLVAYPTQFPIEAFTLCLDRLRGIPVPTPELVQGAWNVMGYALSQALPVGNWVVAEEGEAVLQSDIELLEYAVNNGVTPPADNGLVQGVIPWVSIVLLAMRIIRGLDLR